MTPTASRQLTIRGGCHCGEVRYTATVPSRISVLTCNCSICVMTGFVHLIVPHADFKLLSDWSYLTEYRFATRTARHWFCSQCGIKSFYQPRSHPHAYSLNLACIDSSIFESIEQTAFDGRNFEQAAAGLQTAD